MINIAGKGEFFEECQREVDSPLNSPKGCLMVLHNLKGGAGKTIIAMNLAALLAKAGYKTCLADLDLETAGATNYLFNGSKPPVSIVSWADFPWQQKHDPETVKAFLAQGPAGMWVVPAPAFVYQEKLITDSVAENVLDCLLFHFDYVIVDLGGSLCPSVRAVLQMADVVFLPVTPDEMAISAAVRFATQVVGDGKLLSSDKVRLIVNRYRTRAPRRPVDVARQVNLDLAFVLPDDIPAVDAASRSRDRLVVLARKKTPLKEGFYSLTESLVPGYGSGIKPVPDGVAVEEVALQGVPGESRREKKDVTGLVRTVFRLFEKSRTGEVDVEPEEKQTKRTGRNGVLSAGDNYEITEEPRVKQEEIVVPVNPPVSSTKEFIPDLPSGRILLHAPKLRIGQILSRITSKPREELPNLICVWSPAPAGKTFTAVNLATAYALKGYRTVLVSRDAISYSGEMPGLIVLGKGEYRRLAEEFEVVVVDGYRDALRYAGQIMLVVNVTYLDAITESLDREELEWNKVWVVANGVPDEERGRVEAALQLKVDYVVPYTEGRPATTLPGPLLAEVFRRVAVL